MARMNPPSPKTNLSSIAEREFFILKDHTLDKFWTAMVVYDLPDHFVMLLIDHTVGGSLRGTRINSPQHQKRYEFVRYLTVDETVSITGSDESLPSREAVGSALPISAESVEGPDISDIPTTEEVLAVGNVGLIPDGVYYTMNNRDGERYFCVNCPPKAGYEQLSKRVITVFRFGAGWMSIDNVISHYKWSFTGYADPKDVPSGLKRYPLTVDPEPRPSQPPASDLPTPDQIRANRGLGIIPDGVFYRVRTREGMVYWAVNCPPGKGYIENTLGRTAALSRVNTRSISWSAAIIENRTQQWSFERYVEPGEVPTVLKDYPKP